MKDFTRKMIVSAIVSLCIIFGFWAMCKAYSGIRQIGFGEIRNAVEIKEKEIRFFDYIVN